MISFFHKEASQSVAAFKPFVSLHEVPGLPAKKYTAMRQCQGNDARIGALEWNSNGYQRMPEAVQC